jgi:hypothetical protein
MCEVPFANAAISAARCDIDLSPGRLQRPRKRRAGLIFIRQYYLAKWRAAKV